MSCANFIVSSFHLEPSCFYLFMFFLLTQMRFMNSVGGCKTLNSLGGWRTFSEIFGKHSTGHKRNGGHDGGHDGGHRE
jgi:hypothetical protein